MLCSYALLPCYVPTLTCRFATTLSTTTPYYAPKLCLYNTFICCSDPKSYLSEPRSNSATFCSGSCIADDPFLYPRAMP